MQSTDTVTALAERYPIDGLQLLQQLPITGRNLNLILSDSRSNSYVARCHLRNRDPARIAFQLAFQDHLRVHGVPVPKIMSTSAGEQMVLIDGVTWALFEHVAGSAFDAGDPREIHSAARRLDELHRAGESFAGTVVQDDTIPDLRRWWVRGEVDIDDLRRMFADRGVDDELDFLAAWRERLVRELPLQLIDQLPLAWLHSDYHGSNLAFVDGEVVGIFDFDVVHRGWRLEDVARALHYFARPTPKLGIRAEPAEMFTHIFGLTEIERIALPALIVAVHARNAPRYRIREREGSDPTVALRHHVARMRGLLCQGCRDWGRACRE